MSPRWWAQPCQPVSHHHADAARNRQQQLTKPPGSLGRLEEVAITLAGLQGTERPRAQRVPVVLFAADHGVTAQGVSAFPAEVTVQMLSNFAAGGAAISVLARELGLTLHVRDVGTMADEPLPGTTPDRTRRGTADFSVEAAMTEDDLVHALAAGGRAVTDVADGADALLLGDMGIGNTAAASAVIGALTELAGERLVGAGTGLDAAGVDHKRMVIERSLALHRDGIAGAADPTQEALRRVGGLEIAALTGAILAAAQRGLPVLIDGFVVTAAALAAVRLNPDARPWLIFCHCSAEHGHEAVLDELGAVPLLHLGMRLGEASGAALALPLVRLACALHSEMSTFAEAAVATKADR